MSELGAATEAATLPMLVVTAGLPAAGKSTIAEVVGNRLGLPVLSVDPIEAAILSAGIDAEQPTGLAAYLVAEAMAESVLADGEVRITTTDGSVITAKADEGFFSVQADVVQIVAGTAELV